MKIKSFLLCSLLISLPAMAALSPAPADASAAPNHNVRAIFPNAAINGQPATLMLDTVSTDSALSVPKAKQLTLSFEPPPLESKPLGLAEPANVIIGQQSFTEPFAISPSVLDDVDGMIGWPAVRDNILVFDPDHQTISAITELPPATAGWTKLKIRRSKILALETRLPDGSTGVILVDTGSPLGMGLPSSQWKSWRAAHPSAPSVNMHFNGDAGFIGSGAMEQAWTDTMTLDELTLTDVGIHEMPDIEAKAVGNHLGTIAGTLGMAALARLDLVVDGKNGYAYLRPKPPGQETASDDAKLDTMMDLMNGKDWTVENSVHLDVDSFALNAAYFKIGKNDLASGIATLNQIIEHNPNNTDAYSERGVAKAKKGDWDGALADLNHALELDPENADAYSNRGAVKAQKDDFDGAMADLNHALELDPNNNEAYGYRGVAKAQKGDLDGAMADLNHALELNPQNAGDYINRSAIKLLKGDLGGEIGDLNHVIELDPKNAKAYASRAQAKGIEGNFTDAIADYTRAIELDPQEAELYSERGFAKGSNGDYESAFADYTRSLELNPKNASSYQDLGMFQQIQGDAAGALASYNKSIELDPDDSTYARLYREILLSKTGKAPTDFSQTVAGWKDGWPKSVGQFLSGGLEETALLAAAEKPGDEPVNGQHCEAYYYIGMMHLLKGDIAGARDFFQKSLATGEKDYDEYDFARAELARLDAAEKK